MSLGMVNEIKIIDDYTIALVTQKPYAPLLNNLALWLCPILSPKAMEQHKDQIGLNPVGTGPFKFVKWVKDDQIILERNNDYWGEKAKLDRIILKSSPEPSARLMALQSGTVDIADDLDPDSINLVKKEATCHHRKTEHQCRVPGAQHGKPASKIPASPAINHA
jgi:peptide/nickel transport system substrate-binding protein